MIKNYFKIAWRTLLKDKLSSSINIGGLAIGLSIGILIMLMIADETGFDKFHQNIDRLYLLMKNDNNSGEVSTFRSTPASLSPALQGPIPEIKRSARITYNSQHLIEAGNKRFFESGFYADVAFAEMFRFAIVEGNPIQSLQSGAIVITERTAIKLFGTGSVAGKSVLYNGTTPLQVGAVLKDIPTNSTLQFDIMLPFNLFEQQNKHAVGDWGNNFLQTWVELASQTDLTSLNNKLKKLFSEKTESTNSILFAYPFERLHLHGEFRNGVPSGGKFQLILVMSTIGLFVLLIACINFMNLATAKSERRAKEVGVRKVLGAERKSIIFQFLSEAIVMTAPAMLLAIVLVSIILPVFNTLTDKNIVFDFTSTKIWISLLLIALVTGLVAGSYPAIYLSRFKPIKVLKGATSLPGGGSLLRRLLVTAQFTIAVFLVITAVVTFKQLSHVQNRPIGYDTENLLSVPVRGDVASRFEIIKNEWSKIPGVTSISAGADNLLFMGAQTDGIMWPGKTDDQNHLVTVTRVNYNWASTAGLNIVEGRDFDISFGADTAACLVNEAAVRKMNLKAPVVGTKLGDQTIIGVIKDFVFNSPERSPEPLVVFLDENAVNHIFVRIKNDQGWKNTISSLGSAFNKVNPHYPFEFNFVNEDYQKKFKGIQSAVDVISFTGTVAILISCLGLFALAAFVAERRSKEISIRKVLGASVTGVWLILSKDFLKPVVYGFLLAAPLAALAMNALLDKMDYRVNLSWWMFAGAGLLVLFIALATVSAQAIKAAIANPVNSLRNE